jgi:hypothetical protein
MDEIVYAKKTRSNMERDGSKFIFDERKDIYGRDES